MLYRLKVFNREFDKLVSYYKGKGFDFFKINRRTETELDITITYYDKHKGRLYVQTNDDECIIILNQNNGFFLRHGNGKVLYYYDLFRILKNICMYCEREESKNGKI